MAAVTRAGSPPGTAASCNIPDDARLLVYIHALSLDNVDQELDFGRPDWTVDGGIGH